MYASQCQLISCMDVRGGNLTMGKMGEYSHVLNEWDECQNKPSKRRIQNKNVLSVLYFK